MPARLGRTYRSVRRQAAKMVRKFSQNRGKTITEVMEHAPLQRANHAQLVPIHYQKFSKTSPKVYRGGNVPGSVRRQNARIAEVVARMQRALALDALAEVDRDLI